MAKIVLRLVCVIVLMLAIPAHAEKNQVTTYVITTQQERDNTRWTLTEWLKIKERMKMMDLWLAMFSEPEKDKFSPEVSFFYAKQKGDVSFTGKGQTQSTITHAASVGRAQLWLTNLISGTVGLKTLNVDFGLESYLQMTDSLLLLSKPSLRYYSGNFRIFGKNIQDSSLVLKYGEYSTEQNTPTLFNASLNNLKFSNYVIGGELQLYLFRWLGFEGNYLFFMKGQKNSIDLQGDLADYGVYIEVSLIRLMGGIFTQNWQYTDTLQDSTIKEKKTGMYAGLKIML